MAPFIAVHNCLIFFVLLITWIVRPIQSETLDFSEIDDMLRSSLNCHQFASAGIVVVQNDKVIHKWAGGIEDAIKGNDSMQFTTSESLITVASLTKAFTATLITLLQDVYNFSTSTPIEQLLRRTGVRDFKFKDSIRTKEANLDDLLAHRMGIPRYDIIWSAEGFPPKELYRRVQYMKSNKDFRKSMVYNNNMYNLAADVLQQLSGGLSWPSLLHQYILKPLGMNTSGFVGDKHINMSRLLRGVIKPFNSFQVPRELQIASENAIPALGLLTTLDDFSLWLRLLSRSSRFINTSIPALSSQSLDVIEKMVAQTTQPMNPYLNESYWATKQSYLVSEVVNLKQFANPVLGSYAKGWQTTTYRGYHVIMHMGSLYNIECSLYWIPSRQIVVFVTVNAILTQDNSYYSQFAELFPYTVIDRLLGFDAWIHPDNICRLFVSSPFIVTNTTTVPQLRSHFNLTKLSPWESVQYPGVYANEALGMLNITLQNNSQHLPLLAQYGRYWKVNLYPIGMQCNLTSLISKISDNKYVDMEVEWVGVKIIFDFDSFWYLTFSSYTNINVCTFFASDNACDAAFIVVKTAKGPRVMDFLIGDNFEYNLPLMFSRTNLKPEIKRNFTFQENNNCCCNGTSQFSFCIHLMRLAIIILYVNKLSS